MERKRGHFPSYLSLIVTSFKTEFYLTILLQWKLSHFDKNLGGGERRGDSSFLFLVCLFCLVLFSLLKK